IRSAPPRQSLPARRCDGSRGRSSGPTAGEYLNCARLCRNSSFTAASAGASATRSSPVQASTFAATSIALYAPLAPDAEVAAHEWAGIFAGQVATCSSMTGAAQLTLPTSVEPDGSGARALSYGRIFVG